MSKNKPTKFKPTISNFPGAIPVFNRIMQMGIDKTILKVLGKRAPQAYQYDEAFIGWLMTIYCHGFRLFRIEDSKKDLSMVPNLNLCSHDTIGRLLKQVATESIDIDNKNKKKKKGLVKQYKICDNEKMSDLLIKITKKVGLLKEGESYTLDMDATHVFSRSKEAKGMFKGGQGYTPMVCMINQMPVYISLRSGNANSHYMQKECLENCLKLLEKNNIKINKIRIDGAGYNKEVTAFIQGEGIEFLIGADWDPNTLEDLEYYSEWKQAPYQTSSHQWFNAEFNDSPFWFKNDIQEHPYRIVAIRVAEKNRDTIKHKTKWRLNDGYYYKFLLTTSYFVEPQELFEQYNKRGAIERNFDYLKNDFGWKTLPFSKLNENLVHLIMGAIANNVYLALVRYFAKVVATVKATFRLPNFLRAFIKDGFFSLVNKKFRFFNTHNNFEKLI